MTKGKPHDVMIWTNGRGVRRRYVIILRRRLTTFIRRLYMAYALMCMLSADINREISRSIQNEL